MFLLAFPHPSGSSEHSSRRSWDGGSKRKQHSTPNERKENSSTSHGTTWNEIKPRKYTLEAYSSHQGYCRGRCVAFVVYHRSRGVQQALQPPSLPHQTRLETLLNRDFRRKDLSESGVDCDYEAHSRPLRRLVPSG